jgi:hypothetical protein
MAIMKVTLNKYEKNGPLSYYMIFYRVSWETQKGIAFIVPKSLYVCTQCFEYEYCDRKAIL